MKAGERRDSGCQGRGRLRCCMLSRGCWFDHSNACWQVSQRGIRCLGSPPVPVCVEVQCMAVISASEASRASAQKVREDHGADSSSHKVTSLPALQRLNSACPAWCMSSSTAGIFRISDQAETQHRCRLPERQHVQLPVCGQQHDQVQWVLHCHSQRGGPLRHLELPAGCLQCHNWRLYLQRYINTLSLPP